jgi:hypothetical protein
VQTHKDAEFRIDQIRFTPRKQPTSVLPLHAIGRRVRDLIRINLRPAGGHTITRDCFISGIGHDLTQEGDWTVTWDLQSASPWTGFSTSLWNTGVWDTATWFI